MALMYKTPFAQSPRQGPCAMSKKGFTTTNLHADRRGNPEHGVLHKPIHPSVAYGYQNARHLAEVFQGKRAGYSYGRQVNPTVTALQERITLMEDGLASVAFATGMAAIGSTLLSLLRAGDHLVSSAFLFGNTNSLFLTLQQLGIEVSFVDATNVDNVAAEIRGNTRPALRCGQHHDNAVPVPAKIGQGQPDRQFLD
jgi:O-acetylhomoserine (thiol)-lyase